MDNRGVSKTAKVVSWALFIVLQLLPFPLMFACAALADAVGGDRFIFIIVGLLLLLALYLYGAMLGQRILEENDGH